MASGLVPTIEQKGHPNAFSCRMVGCGTNATIGCRSPRMFQASLNSDTSIGFGGIAQVSTTASCQVSGLSGHVALRLWRPSSAGNTHAMYVNICRNLDYSACGNIWRTARISQRRFAALYCPANGGGPPREFAFPADGRRPLAQSGRVEL